MSPTGVTILNQGGEAGMSVVRDTSLDAHPLLELRDIAYGGGVFVVLSKLFQDGILYSTDGISWNFAQPWEWDGSRLTAITYANGQFLALGPGVMATSSNGRTWTKHTPPLPDSMAPRSVGWGNGIIVASGEAVYSQDRWLRTSYASRRGGDAPWHLATVPGWEGGAVAWGANLFVSVGDNIQTSPDGVTWTSRTGQGHWFTDVAWSDTLGMFLAFDTYGDDVGLLGSPDGINWTSFGSGPSSIFAGSGFWEGSHSDISISWSDSLGMWAAIGGTGATFTRDRGPTYLRNTIITSKDGQTWEPIPFCWPAKLHAVAAGHGMFVAVGRDGLIVRIVPDN